MKTEKCCKRRRKRIIMLQFNINNQRVWRAKYGIRHAILQVMNGVYGGERVKVVRALDDGAEEKKNYAMSRKKRRKKKLSISRALVIMHIYNIRTESLVPQCFNSTFLSLFLLAPC